MSEQRKFFKASSNYLLSQIAVLAISLISFPIVVRLLSVEDYGVLSLCNTILLFAVALSKLGMQNSIIRFYPAYKKRKELPCFFRSYAFVAVVLGFVFFWVSGLITYFSVPFNFSSLAWLVAAVAFVQTLYSYLSNFLRSEEKSTLFAISETTNRALTSFGGVALLFWLNNGVVGLFQAQFIGQAFVFMFLLIICWQSFKGGGLLCSRSLLSESLKFGLPLVAFEMSSILLAFSDRFLISYFNGMEKLGIYAVGYTLCMYIGNLLRQPISMTVGPMYTRIYETEGADRASEFLADLGRIVALVAFPVFFGCTAVKVDLITFLASEKYLKAAPIIPWVLGGFLLYACQPVISAGMFLKKKTTSLAVISLICVVLNITANYFLLPHFGVIAAAWTTAGSYALIVALTFCISLKLLLIKWPLDSIVKYFIASLAMYLIIDFLPTDYHLFLKIFIGAVTYSLFALVLDEYIRSKIKCFIQRFV